MHILKSIKKFFESNLCSTSLLAHDKDSHILNKDCTTVYYTFDPIVNFKVNMFDYFIFCQLHIS